MALRIGTDQVKNYARPVAEGYAAYTAGKACVNNVRDMWSNKANRDVKHVALTAIQGITAATFGYSTASRAWGKVTQR
jgi:hypothetical protein